MLIVPQKIQSFEPATIVAILGYGLAAGSLGTMYKGQEFLNWWYGTGKKTEHSVFDPNCPKCVQEKAAQEALHSGFDPNCAQCIEERAVKQQAQPVVIKAQQPAPVKTTATQVPETRASQVVINNTTHNTTITAAKGNTIVVTPEAAAAPAPTPPPAQTIQTQQTVAVAPQPTPPAQIEKVLPATKELETAVITSAHGNATSNTLLNRASPLTTIIYDRAQDLYQNHYGKVQMAAAATGYLYILYSISSLQRYLTDPKRICLWFSEYDLNKLLLLNLDQIQELVIQEFITTYNVSDQKSLKPAVSKFLNDIETELASLQSYQTIAGRINTVSSIAEKCCSPFSDMARTIIPFAGMVLDYAPTVSINNLFFVNSTLQTSIQDRISRIHYYKNIFLQSTIVV